MAIVRWYPAVVGPDEIPAGQMLLVDSDARDNAHAIVEVERRCSQHGLRRTKELHLAVVHSEDGVTLRRGRCYRPYPDEVQAESEAAEAHARRVRAEPMTASSVELLREH